MAILKVLSDILLALDTSKLAALMMLDMSAAFDSVDHAATPETEYIIWFRRGFGGTVIHWFTSYVSGRTQRVNTAASTSQSTTLSCGVTQGAVLGPIFFVLYTADLMSIVKRHQLLPHAYADDVQIYGSCTSSEVGTLQERISVCFEEVSAWTASNRLQLNPSKT